MPSQKLLQIAFKTKDVNSKDHKRHEDSHPLQMMESIEASREYGLVIYVLI